MADKCFYVLGKSKSTHFTKEALQTINREELTKIILTDFSSGSIHQGKYAFNKLMTSEQLNVPGYLDNGQRHVPLVALPVQFTESRVRGNKSVIVMNHLTRIAHVAIQINCSKEVLLTIANSGAHQPLSFDRNIQVKFFNSATNYCWSQFIINDHLPIKTHDIIKHHFASKRHFDHNLSFDDLEIITGHSSQNTADNQLIASRSSYELILNLTQFEHSIDDFIGDLCLDKQTENQTINVQEHLDNIIMPNDDDMMDEQEDGSSYMFN